MANSRVFIKGLPPSINEDDFRTHFSKRHPVTDVKLMPQRRIGYVGYKTAEDAQAAIKYFNKSFLRMSKLHLEPAFGFTAPDNYRPTGYQTVQTLKYNNEKVDGGGEPARKRRHDNGQDNTQADLTTPNAPNKRSKPNDQNGVTPRPASVAEEGSHTAVTSANPDADRPEEAPNTVAEAEEAQGRPKASDDADWMRSRTTRLLGLVEDDDDTNAKSNTLPDGFQSTITNAPEDGKMSDKQSPSHEEDHAQHSPDPTVPQAEVQPTRRLFLRNLAYSISEDDLRGLLASYGSLSEVQVPHDLRTGASKGFAFAGFEDVQSAQNAIRELDGTTFQGRLLHVLPSAAKRESKLDEFAIAQLPLKKRKLLEKKQSATASTFNWNSMFMNADAVLSSTAARLGVAKSEVFDPTSSDAAVKQAQAETNTIQSTKKYFEENGVNLDSFSSSNRNGRALLVKNFKYDTSPEDIKKLFTEGSDLNVVRILMPPAGTIAILELANEVQAASALRSFSYRRLKDSILFLERAPKDVFERPKAAADDTDTATNIKKDPKKLDSPEDDEANNAETSTIFVRNLNFSTTTDRLLQEFKPLDGLQSALVKTRPDPKNEGKTLSMGFGFLEFQTHDHAKAALKSMNGHVLEGHELQLKASHKGNDAAADRRRDDAVRRQKERSSKVVIKNLPFEASRKDVRNLFKTYGQLQALRMPKKLNNTSRGYAFAQFKTPKEAENALNALSSTHLLGRRLVLHYAADEPEDPEEQIAKMQRKVGKQSESVALQKLTAHQRRKLNLDDSNKVEEG